MCATCRLLSITGLAFIVHAALQAQTKAPDGPKVDWQKGPLKAKLGSLAKIDVPEGYLFADGEGARIFLQLMQNIPSGNELGLLTPADSNWFVIFEFSDVGYVKDDEKASLDANAMLKSIQEATEASNEERKNRGWGTMTVVGWIQQPHYDDSTHNLEWALQAKDEKGELVVNHKTRYLGRRGYMSTVLVVDDKDLIATLPAFRKAMTAFSYAPDNDYRSFVRGDKVAEYGLSALIVGGAAAVAAKTGFFKLIGKFLLVFWKLVLAGIAGIGALLKKLFTKDPQDAVLKQPSTDGQ